MKMRHVFEEHLYFDRLVGLLQGEFVRPKYRRRKLKLCHLFICVLLFTSCLEKPSTQHLMFLSLTVFHFVRYTKPAVDKE